MKTASSKTNRVNRKLPALVAVGSCMAVLPASALELGELIVQSSIGKPLRASIAFALAPHEQITRHCVSLRPGSTAGGLPGIGNATISVGNGVILLAGTTPVREPMLATQVIVDCPYTAKISREYTLFVDPPYETATPGIATSRTAAPTPVAQQANAPEPVTRQATVRRPATVRHEPIANATPYKVKFGDSLSKIVARIENRTLTMWPAVELIFAANPDAFMGNDPNRLKAGSWLSIPDLGGRDAVVVNDAPVRTQIYEPTIYESTTYEPTIGDTAYVAIETTAPAEIYEPTYEDVEVTVVEPVAETSPVSEVAAEITPEIAPEFASEFAPEFVIVDLTESDYGAPTVAEVTTIDLRPGDIVLDDSAFVEPASSSGSEVSAGIQPESTASSSSWSSWIVWLAGGSVAFVLALLMFGKRLRGLFGSTPVGPVLARPERRKTDYATSDTGEIEVTIIESAGDDSFAILDDMPTSENLILDADLIEGTGLEEGTDMDMAQDFGFAATSILDIELPFQSVASANVEKPVSSSETEILPLAQEPTILENEVLPEEDDYDMSVIVDATKMPQPEDATEFDLKAVEVDSGDETMTTSGYTMSDELDYKIVEQDYEDEMTATQLLNKEIAEAALKLSDDEVNGLDDDPTSDMPMATVTDLEVTAQMPETGANEVTAEFPAKTGKGG